MYFVSVIKFLRDKAIVQPDRYLRKNAYATGATQERRRPDRTDVVPARIRNKPL
jgi:hypothetical protein